MSYQTTETKHGTYILGRDFGGARRRGRILKPRVDRYGYARLNLSRGPERMTRCVHVLVAMAFHGERPPGSEACHQNGRKLDCRAENLRWGSPASNGRDKIRMGEQLRGETHPHARLTAGMVQEIRENKECLPAVAMSLKFGVSQAHIYAIKRGERWGSSTKRLVSLG